MGLKPVNVYTIPELKIRKEDGSVTILPQQGEAYVPIVSFSTVLENGFRLREPIYGNTIMVRWPDGTDEPLPPAEEGRVWVASILCAQVARQNGRADIIAPDTTPGSITPGPVFHGFITG